MPSPMSAAGGVVQIRGLNFGGESNPVEVLVAGVSCPSGEWLND